MSVRLQCFAVLGTCAVVPLTAAPGQNVGPRLVVPVLAESQVAVVADSFPPSSGPQRPLRVYRPLNTAGPLPVVVFANGSNADFNTWRGYVDWARLVTSRRMAAVLYQGPALDAQRSFADLVATSAADLDSVLAHLTRRAGPLGVDANNVVIWAGSAPTFTGTRVALTGARPGIRGYVLYYGGGTADDPRAAVPVLIARAGLDNTQLNRGLDSLAQRLTSAGVPVTVVSHPSGPHAFDVADSSAATARVIAATLDFMATAVTPAYQAAIAAGVPAARAAAAFAAGRWADAERLYTDLVRANPANRVGNLAPSASRSWRRDIRPRRWRRSTAPSR
jgi:dienelactone hydrolase